MIKESGKSKKRMIEREKERKKERDCIGRFKETRRDRE